MCTVLVEIVVLQYSIIIGDRYIYFSLSVYTHMHTYIQPRDPCPAYPVFGYTFDIFDYNGNVITTINHTGNTSVNINGSNHGLLWNQMYYLTVEAINAVGRTPSEEILFCESNHIDNDI